MSAVSGMDRQIASNRSEIEQHLRHVLNSTPRTALRRAAEYVSLNAGRRWRALIVIAAGEAFAPDSLTLTLDGACGIELAHTASLVLDDLPSADNGQIRRGQLCVHLAFPNWVVDLLPSYLVNLAYRVSLANKNVAYDRRVRGALELGLAGEQMSAGQEADLTLNGLENCVATRAHLVQCYGQKTGSLFEAAAKMGAILGGASLADVQSLGKFGMNLGIAFQCHDDLTDDVIAAGATDKQCASRFSKATVASVLGRDVAQECVSTFRNRALEHLECLGNRAEPLHSLLRHMSV